MSGQHHHKCATPGCPHFYFCTVRDCRLDWICPKCEDDERFDDIERMNQARLSATKDTQTWQS